MKETATVYCARCARDVEPVRAWSGYIWIKRVWYAGLGVLALLMPVIMSEITLLLPMAMAFAMAAGPVHALAAERSTCSDCGAELASPNRARPSRAS
jgi:DNA-directed RNA polymerase subunit RPC12/RpoP